VLNPTPHPHPASTLTIYPILINLSQAEKSYQSGNISSNLYLKKLGHMLKEQFYYCTMDCSELMWINRNSWKIIPDYTNK
jgi:hypothetical protein